MKSYKPFFVLVTILLSSVLLGGCASNNGAGSYADLYDKADKKTNILGIFEFEKASYEPAGMTTFSLRSDDVISRNDVTGDKCSLLWGLVTITDY